ncbi:putative polyketide synthase [Fusarium proliferatum ET1]|uniref:Probable polyketide synthase n=1 Tax=Fusarium proliferatum (strain ET1) TaxID=1227346 RepID=A0A1L7VWJ8_FUSPR|nr:putative polyketide synthase [Fusarium proliferatum ET1]CZR44814.1 probable polyketide synthase [Fusarium proliferatum ET1]
MTKSETITIASTSQTRGNGRGSQTEQNMIPVDTATPDEDPLCIVGMACRLPGGIRSPDDLWDFLMQKKSAYAPVPADRYNIDGFYHPQSNRSGATNVPGGYFINEDVRQFDNAFFDINNLEATYMDPQQRKILEVVYECLVSSGTSMEAVAGSNTGVYVANFTVDYQPLQLRDPDYLHRYVTTGSGATIMSNRISHVFNLHGPSLSVDTACSSSIYAFHQAIKAIKAGDCDSAIVASANLILSPEPHIAAAKSGVLSSTGMCLTFDKSANGYGRAEGVNSIYIKRLSAAVKDGNPIRAVIRGSALNANGRTPGISLPDSDFQELAMRKAYKDANLDVSGTDYVECHGTGTAVGDPIEVEAIGRVFDRGSGSQLMLGSVKTNVGHSEAASGLTSVLKVVQSFEKGQIPPTRGILNLNPKLVLAERNLMIAQDAHDWPRNLRRASINSFGYGGANAHIILESAESYLGSKKSTGPSMNNATISRQQRAVLLPLSASSPFSLKALVDDISSRLPRLGLADEIDSLAYTLTKGRDHLSYRTFILADLDKSGKIVRSMRATTGDGDFQTMKPLPLGFVFTGQGAQYPGMAKELLTSSESFCSTIRRLDSVLQALAPEHAPDWTLEETILDSSTTLINEVERSQPVCTAVQIAIVELLHSWGVQCNAVVGHSSGEIAAAYCAGIISASQAITVAYFRGYAAGKMTTSGSMMAVGLSDAAAELLIESKGLADEIRVACINAPESVTLSGSDQGIQILKQALENDNRFCRLLQTGGRAYHSSMMEEVGGLYEDLLVPLFSGKVVRDGICCRPSNTVTMFSSVSPGTRKKTPDMPVYWRMNLEQPVQFSSAISGMISDEGNLHLIEIGPHSALEGPIKQIRKNLQLTEASLPYSSALVRKQDADQCVKTLAGKLFSHGYSVNWDAINTLPSTGLRILHELAPYPWDYTRNQGVLWSEPRASYEMRNRKFLRHELLGTRALTGNDIDYTWRNLLRLGEIPWLKDHCLEDQIVFPATGYMAMAIEALSQILEAKDKPAEEVSFEFRNVNISAALQIPSQERDVYSRDTDLELHTTMSGIKISNTTSSVDWHEFSISSWQAGKTMLHCMGSICLTKPLTARDKQSVTLSEIDGFDKWSMNKWYVKWHEEGLCFGPHFRSLHSLQTDGGRSRREAIGITKLEPPLDGHGGTPYTLHPITMDAAIQAAALSTAAGHVDSLRAWLPVFISECRIQAPSSSVDVDVEIQASSEETGLSSRSISATVRDSTGKPVIDYTGLRVSLYTGKTATTVDQSTISQGGNNPPTDLYTQRNPTLRVTWKPDIQRLDPSREDSLKSYIAAFVDQQTEDVRDDESLSVMSALLDLAGHKNPRMRVLELGGDELGYKARHWQSALSKDTAFSRCRSWHVGTLTADGDVSLEPEDGKDPFDVLLLPRHDTSKQFWDRLPRRLSDLLSDQGIIITRTTSVTATEFKASGFDLLDAGNQISLGVRPLQMPGTAARNVFIVRAENASATVIELGEAISATLSGQVGISHVTSIKFHEVDTAEITEVDICISLLEMENEFLATMNSEDMERLRSITSTTTDLLWITGANMLGPTPNPNLTLSNGLSRALMLEQPALCFSILDVGSLADLNTELICSDVIKVLGRVHDRDDCEFIQKDGLLHISRYCPDNQLNSLFRRRLGLHAGRDLEPLANSHPARLSIDRIGAMDSLFFQTLSEPTTHAALDPGYVDVDVRAISLNAKDVYTMSGRVDTRNMTTAFDFSGLVTSVGPDVSHVAVGDRVVASAPHHLGTSVRVPAGCAHKMTSEEEFTVMPSMMVIYPTALYALNDRAYLRAGESILIHAGSGGLGIAAITLARRIGATVYTTVGSDVKREYLINELSVPSSHIFNSRDSTFVQGIMNATGGRGVDVILNSLVGDLMHDSWRCLADFGRFVEVGKRELVDAGRLDMSMFLRNATFTAFDLSELFYSQDQFYRSVWDRLISETLKLYRDGEIQPPPIKVFDVSQIAQAYRSFLGKDRVGKIVISMEDQQARVPVAPPLYLSVFDPEKVYLLVGCLGGLGRSLSRWMMTRGARRFVFLGRSGADRPSARQLISRLKQAGATVEVVRGDVCNLSDVTKAVEACVSAGRRIGGIVQAAMGLSESLFTSMSNEAWHTGIDPKWQGTWNLHNALQVHVDKDQTNEPDFFLLTSSVSGTVGTATESNYCSANGFLDAFARWRRSRGQACVSVGLGMISEVGYLHENPEIESLLLRKGIQPLNEDAFLQIVDLALNSERDGRIYDSHLLTGLESAAIRELSAQGFDVTSHGVLNEARSSILLASVLAEKEAQDVVPQDGHVAVVTAAEWFKSIPSALSPVFASVADSATLRIAIMQLIKTRFSNLILVPTDQISEDKPLPNFGVDSMIASEFRSWFWAVLRIDIPFLDIMSTKTALGTLAEFVEGKL